MPDYYSILARRIKETESNPTRIRQVIYEAARLALRRQLLLRASDQDVAVTKGLLDDLEKAIIRCEIDAAKSGIRNSLPPYVPPRPVRAAASAAAAEAGQPGVLPEPHQQGEHEHLERPEHEHPHPEQPHLAVHAAASPDDGPTAGTAAAETQDEAEWDDADGPHGADMADPHPDARADFPDESEDPHGWPLPGASSRPRDLDAMPRDLDEVAPVWGERQAALVHSSSRNGRPDTAEPESGLARTEWPAPATIAATPLRPEPPRLSQDLATVVPRRHDDDEPDEPDTAEFSRFGRADATPSRESRDTDWTTERADDDPRELVMVREPVADIRPARSYVVRSSPQRAVMADDISVVPNRSGRCRLLGGLGQVAQLVGASVAGVALYVAVVGRGGAPPALSPPAPAVAVRGAPAVNLETVQIQPTPSAPGRAPANVPAALAMEAGFPYPTSYGIYAVNDGRLIELEQIATQPVDPRVRNVMQIAKPSRTIIPDGRLSFVAYRRDLVVSAPEKVPVRIAARIARSMNFDASGKAVVATPPTDTWLVREQGFDLRVSPVRDSAEMMLLRPDGSDFTFPAGRYELMIGGQAYDFVVAGDVSDPAQCVEGVATARGPAFYECRTQ